jgi:hypothetical protein
MPQHAPVSHGLRNESPTADTTGMGKRMTCVCERIEHATPTALPSLQHTTTESLPAAYHTLLSTAFNLYPCILTTPRTTSLHYYVLPHVNPRILQASGFRLTGWKPAALISLPGMSAMNARHLSWEAVYNSGEFPWCAKEI